MLLHGHGLMECPTSALQGPPWLSSSLQRIGTTAAGVRGGMDHCYVRKQPHKSKSEFVLGLFQRVCWMKHSSHCFPLHKNTTLRKADGLAILAVVLRMVMLDQNR